MRRSRRASARAGTAAIGVAVTTRTPKAARSTRSRPATTGWVAATTGALASQPIQPPPACMAAEPSAGTGVPLSTCIRPQAARTRAPQPMVTRPVAALSSGLRSTRQARPSRRNGRTTSRLPSAPVTSVPTIPPRPVVTFHQTENATRIASAMNSRPRPSRRWAGSRSLAPRPSARTAPPTTWPIPSQTRATARAIPLKKRDTGEGPTGAGRRAPGARQGAPWQRADASRRPCPWRARPCSSGSSGKSQRARTRSAAAPAYGSPCSEATHICHRSPGRHTVNLDLTVTVRSARDAHGGATPPDPAALSLGTGRGLRAGPRAARTRRCGRSRRAGGRRTNARPARPVPGPGRGVRRTP